ncbi:MAG: acyl-CoA-binding protein [Candidatus Hydrogenedentes bacterium]|nr:acyl-CoA-binding protein [Candidatus Hydrogenedentota bacterium]
MSEDLKAAFLKAKDDVVKLSKAPDNDVKLQLYALYKQSTDGDCTGARPGMLDFVGRVKYDMWKKLEGTTNDAAMQQYIDLVEQLKAADGK